MTSLNQKISVETYNPKISSGMATGPMVIDSNQNGYVDSTDQLIDTQSGELFGREKLMAFQTICDVMAPGNTSFLISPSARAYLKSHHVVVEKNQNGETINLPTEHFGVIPIQSFGTYNTQTNQCELNQPGVSQVTLDASGQLLVVTGTDAKGKFESKFNLGASDANDLESRRELK